MQYITRVTAWAQTPPAERQFRVMWMQGPAGVGKSAIAQSCAEQVGTKLAAAFFFSRPHNRDISTRLFPSIAYQLTRKYPAYREKLDQILFDDRTLVDKSLAVQFRELILTPLEELQEEGESVEEGIIFIDGLDKCAGEEAQCTIIDLISASVRDRATPFIWAFFCRPEPRVVAQFRAAHVHDLCWPLKIRVSHEADADIELYLKDAFQKICVQYDIPSAASWPSEEDIRELVERSVGLFIYPTSVVRYVGDGGPLGPEEQLRLVLQLPSRVSGRPWSHLDAFYILIMEQIPKDMLPYTLELLLFHRYVPSELPTPVIAATILDFSLAAYGAALSRLHSVIKLKRTPDGLPKAFKFYHASFIEFLGDPERSGEFCFIRPELCAMVLVKSIKRINEGFSDGIFPIFCNCNMRASEDGLAVVVPWQDAKLDSEAGRFYLQDGTSATFWRIASRSKLDEDLLQRLSECDYRNMKCHLDIRTSTLKRFFDNVSHFLCPIFASVKT